MHLGNVRRGVAVMVALLTNILTFIIGKEGKEMMAMLWAQQIMMGKKTYGQVPRLLKEKVREILEDSGMAELVKEDEEKA